MSIPVAPEVQKLLELLEFYLIELTWNAVVVSAAESAFMC